MTLAEMRTEVYNSTGVSSIDPSDTDSGGGRDTLDTILNVAQQAVAVYKDPQGRRSYHRTLFAEMFFTTVVVSGTISSPTTTTVTLSADAEAEADRYNGWLLSVAGVQDRLVMDYTSGRVATVNEAWGTAPTTGVAFTLRKRFMLLVNSGHAWAADHITLPSVSTDRYLGEGNLQEILRITDMEDLRVLRRGERGQDFTTRLLTYGTPDRWYRQGNRLVFDVASDAARWYKLDYYRLPVDMDNTNVTTSELEEAFHWAIVLRARWQVYQREEETSMAFAAKRDFYDEMQRVTSAWEMSNQLENLRMRVAEGPDV